MEGWQFSLTPSICISVFAAGGGEVDELLSNADTATYAAKKNGRAAFQFFSAVMNSGATACLEVTTAVPLALKRNELKLHYQPQIEVHSGRLCGVEALIWWNHPECGLANPGAFIPVVEAIITLAHATHLAVLAEGVETIEEATLLRDRGCDQFQGYLFAKPTPAAEMEAWLQAGCAPVGA